MTSFVCVLRVWRKELPRRVVARRAFPWLAGLCWAVAVLWAPAARADITDVDLGWLEPLLSLMVEADDGGLFLNLGPTLTIIPKPSGERTLALGGEGSLHYLHPKEKCLFQEGCVLGVGVFTQFQPLDERQWRWSGGLQATYSIVGLEMGYSREPKTDDRPGMSAFQMAPFLTLGVFSASVRYTIPLSRELRRQRPGGADVAYVLTLKLPLLLGKLRNTR
jgi:hypothetical protein